MSDSSAYPSISVVIPSFNQGQYIEETLISVIGQQYPNLEILVIDGGSTDNTVEILKKYSGQLSYWHSKRDRGQADAINQGIRLSSGQIVCWLNSDDMYLPGTLLDIGKRFCGHLDQNYLIYGAAVAIHQSDGNLWSDAKTASPFDAFRLTYFDFIEQSGAFWTRKLWQSTGELNIHYHYVLDWDWFIRASKVTEFEYVPRFYAVYRFHSLHKTTTGGGERRKEILDIVTTYSSEYWIRLYAEVEKEYESIQKVLKLLERFNIPKRRPILKLLCPKTLSTLKRRQDLFTVLTLYG